MKIKEMSKENIKVVIYNLVVAKLINGSEATKISKRLLDNCEKVSYK